MSLSKQQLCGRQRAGPEEVGDRASRGLHARGRGLRTRDSALRGQTRGPHSGPDLALWELAVATGIRQVRCCGNRGPSTFCPQLPLPTPHLPGLVTPLLSPGSSTASMAPSRRSRITAGKQLSGASPCPATSRRGSTYSSALRCLPAPCSALGRGKHRGAGRHFSDSMDHILRAGIPAVGRTQVREEALKSLQPKLEPEAVAQAQGVCTCVCEPCPLST